MTNNLDLEPAAHIKLDLFPAEVSLEGEILGSDYRAIVTDNHFYVIHDSVDGPYLVVKEPLDSFDGTNKTGYDVNSYHVLRAKNCGCGSRLRGIHPFLYVPYEAQLKR